MASHANQQSLRLYEDKNHFTPQYESRLYNITDSLLYPMKQYPSLISFVGKRYKTRALRSLFPGYSLSSYRRSRVTNISADPTTANNEYPTLIADSSPEYIYSNPGVENACHETVTRQAASLGDEYDSPTQQTQQDLVHRVHARLLLLFTDVLCVFAQDCGGLDEVAGQLTAWTSTGFVSSLPAGARPRLLVVTSVHGADFQSEALRFRLRVLSESSFSSSFASLKVVNVLGSSHAPQRNFGGLAAVLGEEIKGARLERVNTQSLFSMVHLIGLFDLVLRDFTTSP